MTGVIRSPRDFWAGVLYAGFGAAAVLIARDYGLGSSSRMGPGYFPTVLGSLLLLIGLASLVRSFFAAGEPIGAIAWKGLLLVTLATVLFGALLRPAGLVIALAAVILVSAAASVRFRFDARALALMGGLIVFCGLVFVTGLGLPVSLLGTWFTR
ncbi:MAG: tripartite tricarboxylate transporter TctB family protein [Betaproteobacteria bacterium]|nr:tripartite tricarboxylate transporter TctB family protein [Betaproteobacteria bacterium]